MTERIHPDTIEEVKARADIAKIISEYVVLTEQGKDLVGSCPFCKEQPKASFRVSPVKGMYYCFNCHEAGNSIKFLIGIQSRPFSDVVKSLAEKLQIPVKLLGK